MNFKFWQSGERNYTISFPGFIVSAWLFMLGLGGFGFHVGYWSCLAIAAGLAIVNETLAHYTWTKKWKRSYR